MNPIVVPAALLLAGTAAAMVGGSAASSQTGPRCHDREATIVGSEGDDVIEGTDRNDVIVALHGDDEIAADFGHDVVCAGPGNDAVRGGLGFDLVSGDEGDDTVSGGGDPDQIDGGDGADALSGDDGDDHVTGGAGFDEIDGGAGVDWASARDLDVPATVDLSAGVIAALADSDVLTGIENGEGTPFDDTLTGNETPNHLRGGDGADSLTGAQADDVLEGSAGADSLSGDDGRDTASYEFALAPVVVSLEEQSASGEGEDTLDSIENVTGGFYDDRLTGSSGGNVISGGWGEDLLDGGPGSDRFVPGLLDDRVVGGSGRDWMLYVDSPGPVHATMRRAETMGEGVDTYESIEVVSGSNYPGDVIRGDGGPNTLYGGAGADRLYGAGGRDYLVGGPMKDVLSGGGGRDSCEDVMVNRFLGCEARTHVDGPPETVVTRPRHGYTVFYGPSPKEFGGYVGGSRAPVEVALLREANYGCLAWTGVAWEHAACDERQWLRARGQRSWTYDDLPRRLPGGRYQVFAQVRGDEPIEQGRNRIIFHVLRR